MTIYSYIDTLLQKWCEWNDQFLVQKMDDTPTDLNDILGTTGSDAGSRAKEMYRIGLLKKELSVGNAAITDLQSDINIQTDLGFIAALIYKAYINNLNSEKLKLAYASLTAIFSIIQSEKISNKDVSINKIVFKLLEAYPCPKNINQLTWIRWIVSCFYSEYEEHPQKYEDFFTGQKKDIGEIKMLEKNSNKQIITRYVFNSCSQITNTINNKGSLTGIIKQKSGLFLTGENGTDIPKGYYGIAYTFFPDFLKTCYEIEELPTNKIIFERLYSESKENLKNNVLGALNEVADQNIKFKQSFSQIMKNIEEGAREALHISSQISLRQRSSTKSSHTYSEYITALRTKPFMLLAGISGTGKSRIVRKLAQASITEELQKTYDPESVAKGFDRWQLHKPANFELVQVKPNWHNSLEVVGYKSNIGKEGPHYEFTPFVEFVARAWQHPDMPFFLCLDEMNLAPVEQYFAEFLSAIESRSFENGEYETDPIIKPFKDFDGNICESMIDHLLGKVNASAITSDSTIVKLVDRFKNKGLTLPQNLFIMGTVNMDETTFSFSRKVLDRAMSVVMNDVKYDEFFDGRSENDIEELSADTIDMLINRPIKGIDAEDNDSEVVESYLTNVNGVLDNTPFKLGYRAANEALLYVSAAHLLNTADTTTALDEFTMMKILSRIEGDKRSIGTILTDLQSVITESYPESNKKLKKMAQTLIDKQFVSFWS